MPSPQRRSTLVLDRSQLIASVALGLIVVQLVFRGWASSHGWFYEDDLRFIDDYTHAPLSLSLLWRPHDSQFMPGGLLCAWLVAHAGTFNWAAAAVNMTMLQLIADLTCWWMLASLFGRRWWSVVLLSFYLFSTMTLTAFMWWAAGLNQVPTHAAFFGAVTLHLRYLRTRRARWALAAMAAIVLGECFYVKAALFVLPLAVMTAVWFVPSGPRWIRRAARLHGGVALGYLALSIAFAALYTRHVPNPLTSDDIHWADLARSMFGRSLPTVLLGGPWRWTWLIDPAGQVGTPMWASFLCWILVACTVTWLCARRLATPWALAVIAPYVAVTYYLTARGRGMLGGYVGVELRYLADATPVITLAAGLLILPLIGATRQPLGASRGPSLPRSRRGRALAGSIAGLAALGCVLSNVTYVVGWRDYPQRSYVNSVIQAARAKPLRVVDLPVPTSVMLPVGHPYNLPSMMFRPLGDRLSAQQSGTDLEVLQSDGRPGTLVSAAGGARTAPGPVAGCGYPVRRTSVSLPYSGAPQRWDWWAVVRYLSQYDGTLTLTAGGKTTAVPVLSGAHTYVLPGSGAVGKIKVEGSAGNVVCVDSVTVGGLTAMEDPS